MWFSWYDPSLIISDTTFQKNFWDCIKNSYHLVFGCEQITGHTTVWIKKGITNCLCYYVTNWISTNRHSTKMLDLSKAFNYMSNDVLHYGFNSKSILILALYLENCSQLVTYNNQTLTKLHVRILLIRPIFDLH